MKVLMHALAASYTRSFVRRLEIRLKTKARSGQNDSVHELSSSHIDCSEMIKSRNLVDHVKRLGASDGGRGNFCRNFQCNFGYKEACYVQNYPVLTETCETGPHSTLRADTFTWHPLKGQKWYMG